MIEFDFSSDIKRATKQLGAIAKDVVPIAARRAVDDTAKNAEVAARQRISKHLGLPAATVRSKMQRLKANKFKLTAYVIGRGRPLNLINFKAKQMKQGVKASAWGKRKLYKKTFIANKGRTVFVREGRSRLPIKPVFVESIPKAFMNERIMPVVKLKVREQWPKNFKRHFNFYLRRRLGR